MVYEKSEVMRFLGEQDLSKVPEQARLQIFDVASAYAEELNINLSDLLRIGTDCFLLGILYNERKKNERFKKHSGETK